MSTSPIPTAVRNSVWAATVEMPACPPLAGDVTVDVCVVGAGIAGLTTAYLLAKEGKRVAVLDDGPLCGGMTQMTSAHLSNENDDRYEQIEKWHGEEGAKLANESHTAAVDFIERTARELEIDCDFQRLDAFMFRAPDQELEILETELAAARRAGVTVEWAERAPLKDFDTKRCLRFPRQARFHPLKYLRGLAMAIRGMGGLLFTGSHVDSIEGGERATMKVGSYTVTADAVVVATNSPINDLVAIHTKQAPYTTYVIGARVPKGSVPDALYWDTLDAYHYVRLQPGLSSDDLHEEPVGARGPNEEFDLLIVGGEDHKTGQADDTAQRHGRLEAWARERFPMMGDVELTWGGQVLETIDGLAFIGRNPMDKENVFIATGDSGMGLTHGTIAGMLLTDLILGLANPWTELYEPSRKTVKAARPFITENLNVAAQYADWIVGGDVESVEQIPPGSGAVLRRGLSKVAVYRDDDGKVHEMSAVCPHLDCIVHWNEAHHLWDCPCHGSRFAPDGTAITGPANRGLAPVEKS